MFLKQGDFVLEHSSNNGWFMTHVPLEWQDENPIDEDERDWDNPWHRAQMIEEELRIANGGLTREEEGWLFEAKCWRVTHKISNTVH